MYLHIIPRKVAKELGMKRYFTGLKCCRGHITTRWTSTGMCNACGKDAQRSAYRADPEKHRREVSESRARAKERDPEGVRKKRREQYEKTMENPEAKRRKEREWHARMKSDPGYLKRRQGYRRNYREKYPEKAAAHCAKRRANKLKATPPWADEELISEFYKEAAERFKETSIRHHVDHVIPLQHPLVCGLHVHTNLQVMPAQENIEKNNNFDIEEFNK